VRALKKFKINIKNFINKHLACKFLIILLLKTRKQIIKMNHNFIARSWYFYWPSLDSYSTKWIDIDLKLLRYDPPTMFFWSVIATWIRRKQILFRVAGWWCCLFCPRLVYLAAIGRHRWARRSERRILWDGYVKEL